MNEYMLYLILALAFSVSVNAFLFWFSRKSSTRLTIVASNIDEILSALENFGDHLGTLYELEAFYGDETLHSLLRHAKGIEEFLSGFEDIYELSDDLIEQADDEHEEYYDKDEAGALGATTQEEKKKTTKKVVFHSGT